MQNSKNPRTDALELSLTTWTIDDLNKSMSHARQLERELTKSQSWVKASMESAAIASATIALLESERDTLRKMVDAFADCGDCGDEWLMADYRELPHVRARKTK